MLQRDLHAHPDPQGEWSYSTRWSPEPTDLSSKENAVCAVQNSFSTWDIADESRSTRLQGDEDRPSSWDAVKQHDEDNDIAKKMEALEVGRYERPPRRTLLQYQEKPGKENVVKSSKASADDTHSQAYYTADEGTDEESLPLYARQPKPPARRPRIAYTSSDSYGSSISHSSSITQLSSISNSSSISYSSTIRQHSDHRGGKRPRNRRGRGKSIGGHFEARGRVPTGARNGGRDSGRSRIQVNQMQQLQNSILDGSPYFFTREERFADPPPFLDEPKVEPDQNHDKIVEEGIPTYDPVEFKALYNASPCIPFHLKGSCTDLDCDSVHDSAKFAKSGKEALLQFVRSSPCPFGVKCTPKSVRDCLYIHICPRVEHCNDSTCGFLAAAFEGKGHEPNQASKWYAETQDDEQTELLVQRANLYEQKRGGALRT